MRCFAVVIITSMVSSTTVAAKSLCSRCVRHTYVPHPTAVLAFGWWAEYISNAVQLCVRVRVRVVRLSVCVVPGWPRVWPCVLVRVCVVELSEVLLGCELRGRSRCRSSIGHATLYYVALYITAVCSRQCGVQCDASPVVCGVL